MIPFNTFGSQAPPFSLPSLDANFSMLVGAVLTLSINAVPVSAVGVNGSMMQYTLPANTLNVNSKGLLVRAWGAHANNGNATTISLAFGGSSAALNTSSANATWMFEFLTFRTGSNQQTTHYTSMLNAALATGNFTTTATDSGSILISTNFSEVADGDLIQHGLWVMAVNTPT
jgi:hypothetical protein